MHGEWGRNRELRPNWSYSNRRTNPSVPEFLLESSPGPKARDTGATAIASGAESPQQLAIHRHTGGWCIVYTSTAYSWQSKEIS